MRTRAYHILLSLLLPLAFLALLISYPERVDLSAYADVGTQYEVEILRDLWGVPHIRGLRDVDAAFGLAYAHAEDDFLTMQQVLLAARGELAATYGLDVIANDYMVHLLRISDVVAQNYETGLSGEARALLEAYADGLNLFAARHEESLLAPDLFPVSGRDIAAASVHKSPLFFGLDDTLVALFEDERQQEVASPQSAMDVIDTQYGSNLLAVAPNRTPDGSTYLAINSHQPWQGPVTWYEAHVTSEEGWDAVGALFPTSPVIIHGHNRNLGWAFTVNHPDLVDVYVLEMNPEDPDQYWFEGQWHDLEVRQAQMQIKVWGRLHIKVTQEVLWSVYGPTLRRPHGVYALRYAGYGRVDIFEQLYRMNKATTFQQWQAAMRAGALPNFNVGYADHEGTIYYLYNAILPIRSEAYDWTQYLPGVSQDTLWQETLPFEELPQVLNPAAGFVQNSNSTPFHATMGADNPDRDAYSPTFDIETYDTNRSLRARHLFGNDTSISWDDFVNYKYDMAYDPASDMAKIIAMLLASPSPSDPRQRQGLAMLRDWDMSAEPTDRTAALAMLTWYYMALHNEEIKVARPTTDYDIQSAEVWMAYEQAIETLSNHHGRLDVPWQEVNRLRRGAVDVGLGGGFDLLHAIYGRLDRDGRLRGFQGDSYVMLVRWYPDGQVASHSIHQYGSATLDEDSPHYADQAPLFARRQLKPVWFTEADILTHLSCRYRPGQ